MSNRTPDGLKVPSAWLESTTEVTSMQPRINWNRIHTIIYDDWKALQSGVKPDSENVDPEIVRPKRERRVKPWRDDRD
jgi:hypothetical protein